MFIYQQILTLNQQPLRCVVPLPFSVEKKALAQNEM